MRIWVNCCLDSYMDNDHKSTPKGAFVIIMIVSSYDPVSVLVLPPSS